MPKKPKIIVVDDRQMFRQGLVSIISLGNVATVIGEASNEVEFMELITQRNPDLVLMDIDMCGMNVTDATRKALQLLPHLKIIVYNMFGREEHFDDMITLGVNGFILKSFGIIELEEAIGRVMIGESYFPNRFPKKSSGNFNAEKPERPTDL